VLAGSVDLVREATLPYRVTWVPFPGGLFRQADDFNLDARFFARPSAVCCRDRLDIPSR